MQVEPRWRTGVGMALILLLIAGWSALVVAGSAYVAGLPTLVQALYYLVAGVAWIAPLKPLLRWMYR